MEQSRQMLGSHGLLVVSGHNHFPRHRGVDVGEALLTAQDAYGDPAYMNTYSLESIGEEGYGQEAVFVKV